MNPYPAYKDSGIAWLGEIPSHWEVNRFRRVILTKARLGWKGLKASEYVPKGYGFLSTPNIKGVHLDFDNINFITEQRFLESPEIMLQESDILLAKDGSTLGIVNVVRDLPFPSTVNSSIAVLRPLNGDLNSVYVMYFLSSHFMQTLIDLKKDGMGVPHLFQRDINRFPIVLPPLPEQRAIAAYLDRQTQALDELIADKRRLIELYQEERAALINQAVTRGLDPDAPMKDSGIEWLGEIPAHWEVKRLKHISPKVSVGLVINPSTYYDDEGSIPMLTGRNVVPFGFTLRNVRYITEDSSHLLKKTAVFTEDIVVVRVGYPGVAAVISPDLNGANCASMMIVRKSKVLKSRLLAYYFNSYFGNIQIDRVAYGAAQKQFNISHAIDFQFPVPPKEEQNLLLAYLDSQTTQLDTQIADTEREIELLQEYRTALISEVVTGKVDVRGEISNQAHS